MTTTERITAQDKSDLLGRASDYFGRKIEPRKLVSPRGLTVAVDGVAEDKSVLAVVRAQTGLLDQRNIDKIAVDALRLLWVRTWFAPDAEVVVCLACREAARRVRLRDECEGRPQGWLTETLHGLGVSVHVFEP